MTPERDSPVPLSALQHLVFCERQCALIYLERLWAENPLTLEGKALHEQTDSGSAESRGDVRIARSLPLRNHRLGLVGRADVVELHRAPARRALRARMMANETGPDHDLRGAETPLPCRT